MNEEWCYKHVNVKLSPYGVCSECTKEKEQELLRREEVKRKRKELWDSVVWPKR